uniref:Octanoyl-[acyl-carrier-protein]:protein N-octanoyltransferase LIPT2, mitochondrial n=1 Tax=Phallusia mammillata TaxID=59560 RepID=A0A6F9DKF7_9ASCI|nr:putative lipoyltransferase 2, mitochondrial [Phallusia mammillata]
MTRLVFRCFYLGVTRYKNILQLQEKLVKWHQSQPEVSTLLLLQHKPVYTIGLRSKLYNETDKDKLELLGADFVKTNRGGLITFHGPGQLVVYPIFSLATANMGVRNYVNSLEEVVISLCKRYDLNGSRSPHTGVWIGNNKICAMGISCQRSVTSHGLALNCNTDMGWFNKIVPCGIHGKGVTSITECTGTEVTVEDVLSQFIQDFSDIFNCETQTLEVLDENLDNSVLAKLITEKDSEGLIKNLVS